MSASPIQIGDSLDVKGPIPKLSLAQISNRKAVGLLAGGSGLTPMLQVAEEALRQGLPIKVGGSTGGFWGISRRRVPVYVTEDVG